MQAMEVTANGGHIGIFICGPKVGRERMKRDLSRVMREVHPPASPLKASEAIVQDHLSQGKPWGC